MDHIRLLLLEKLLQSPIDLANLKPLRKDLGAPKVLITRSNDSMSFILQNKGTMYMCDSPATHEPDLHQLPSLQTSVRYTSATCSAIYLAENFSSTHFRPAIASTWAKW